MIETTFEELRTQESEVPSLSEFRETVNTLTNIKEAAIIKLLYLGAFSCSEVITKITPWELEHQASKPYGRALDCSFTDYTINGKKEKVLLIRSLVAKRFKKQKNEGEKPKVVWKTVALPCSEKYEPWVLDLGKFILKQAEKHKRDPVWKGSHGLRLDMTRMTLQNIVKRNLKIFYPTIHPRSLRHFRTNHLILNYHFNLCELASYLGSSLKTSFAGTGIPTSMLDVYSQPSWQSYIKKMFTPIETFTKAPSRR